MKDIEYEVDSNGYDDLQAKLAKHGLDLDFDCEDIPEGIFYNADLRSYCGTMIDHTHIVMFPKYIPEYIKKLDNDPSFNKLIVVDKQ